MFIARSFCEGVRLAENTRPNSTLIVYTSELVGPLVGPATGALVGSSVGVLVVSPLGALDGSVLGI